MRPGSRGRADLCTGRPGSDPGHPMRAARVAAGAPRVRADRIARSTNLSAWRRNSRGNIQNREGIMSNRYLTVAAIAAASCSAVLSACGGGSGSGGDMAPANSAPAASFSTPAQATSIHLGQSVALAWSSSYATACTASAADATAGAFTGTVPTSGTQSVAPTATGSFTYTLQCTGAGGMVMAHSQTITVGASILSGLSTITTIGSTLDPVEMGGNPYGLAIAPVSAGLITKGDLVVCNFNDGATNTQGHGTTIVGLHAAAGSMPYSIARSAQLEGCNALAMLPDDSISAAAYVASLNPLVAPDGTVNNPFAAHTFSAPWGEAYVAATGSEPAALYVSNATSGTIDRITLNGDAPTAYTEIAKGFCVSGVPGAVFAPAGLTYDASGDTLRAGDTSSYSRVAFAQAD